MDRTTKKKRSLRHQIPQPKAPDKKPKSKFITRKSEEKITDFNGQRVVFSLRFFDRNTEVFNCGGTEVSWFVDLMDHMKSISELSKNEFLNDRNQRNHYRVHPHNWDELEYKYDLPDTFFEQIECCIQFALSTSNGRVHGFMIDKTFFVVWLDPHHNLYPDEKFGGVKFFSKPLTPYEQLLLENEELKNHIEEYEQLLEEKTNPSKTG